MARTSIRLHSATSAAYETTRVTPRAQVQRGWGRGTSPAESPVAHQVIRSGQDKKDPPTDQSPSPKQRFRTAQGRKTTLHYAAGKRNVCKRSSSVDAVCSTTSTVIEWTSPALQTFQISKSAAVAQDFPRHPNPATPLKSPVPPHELHEPHIDIEINRLQKRKGERSEKKKNVKKRFNDRMLWQSLGRTRQRFPSVIQGGFPRHLHRASSGGIKIFIALYLLDIWITQHDNYPFRRQDWSSSHKNNREKPFQRSEGQKAEQLPY